MSFLTLVSMTPLGKGEGVSKHVAKVVDIVNRSGLPHVVTPMGTIIEGENWDEVMGVLKRGFERMSEECPRISIVMKIDYRKGKMGRIKEKIDSLEEKLGHDLPRIG
ncbi:MAG: MTH1187 family thiamine-binding protein [candidate division WOR-3 bacterium]|nr:MAG: MTH1187 family thiamine-binding protein [candidate division WOR-3 bacterium]